MENKTTKQTDNLKTNERLAYLVCAFTDPLNPYAHYEINPNLTIG